MPPKKPPLSVPVPPFPLFPGTWDAFIVRLTATLTAADALAYAIQKGLPENTIADAEFRYRTSANILKGEK